MRVLRSLDSARGCFERSVVTIGNFDGVHRGHQVILDQLRQDADQRGVACVVLTFQPHPMAIVRPEAAPRLLMPLGDRLASLAASGVDATVVQAFSPAFARIEAEAFIEDFLVDALDAQKLLVGHDLNYGRGRRGTVDSLVEAGGRHGFAVEIIGPVEVDGIVVHSSVVREAVSEGKVALAAQLLGRPHVVRGRIVHGAGRGKALGFATANIRPRTELVPDEGVYATRACLDDRDIDGVTSIGHTPTFGGVDTVIEAHLFEPLSDLYGRNISLAFVEHLRPQRKFDSPDHLVAQIGHDVAAAKEALAAASA